MNELTKQKTGVLIPTTFEEGMRYAELIANSSLCPKGFKDKSGRGSVGDIFIAMQMGAGLGFDPMQAIQNIAVINGNPAIYGDAIPALVLSHPACGGMREWFEGDEGTDGFSAFCGITRNGKEEIRSFSVGDAKKAGLWGKPGPWTQYYKRMLQMRARGFCSRDTFADALKGLKTKEELEDYIEVSARDVTSQTSVASAILERKRALLLPEQQKARETPKEKEVEVSELAQLKNEPVIKLPEIELKAEHILFSIECSATVADLIETRDMARTISLTDEEKQKINAAYVVKNKELNAVTS